MQTRMLVFVLLAGLLALAHPVPGQGAEGAWGPLDDNATSELVKAAPAEAEVPDADALVLFDGTYISYRDGLAEVRRQRLIKIYTEWAIDHLGDPRLAYDGSRQELKIHASRTYLIGGSTQDTPDNGYNEVTPGGLALSVDHLGIREMVVTHVGIERGVSILLDWTVRDVEPPGLPLNRMFFFHNEFSTLRKEVVAEGELRGEIVNPEGGLFQLPAPEERGDLIIWQAENLKPRPQHAEHRLGDQIPWIAISAAGSWDDLLVRLGRRIDAAVAEGNSIAALRLDLEEEMPFLGEREALERLAEAVKDRTALVRYDPWLFTPLPRSVSACLERSTATPTERCAIMLACCRTLGVDAAVVLPARWENLSADVPALEVLSDPLVRVTAGEGTTWWLDPVGGTVAARPPVEGALPYFVIDREDVAQSMEPVKKNDIQIAIFWDLEAGKGRAEGTISGPVVNTLDLEEPEKLLRDWAEGWSDSAEVEELKVLASGPEGLAYTVSLEAPVPAPGDRGRTAVDLPMPPVALTELLPQGMDLEHSEVDGILFPVAPARIHLTWNVRFPDDLVLLDGPALNMVWEDVSLLVMRTERSSTVKVEYELDWGGRTIIPEEYTGYRNIFLEATDPGLSRVVFGEPAEE
jgi:hypothetical protein